MTGFALSGDLFDMFVFFELMSAVAYALTGFRVEEPEAVQGGLTFGVVNSLGAYVTLFGIGLLYARTGALGLAPLAVALAAQPRDLFVVVAATLVVVGFLVKGALVPFHFWLDDAHAVAPTPVCVLFSGIMVELGLYGAARVGAVVFGPDLLHPTLEVLGAVTAVVGAIMCLAQRHLKRLLAYSTIGHAGLFAAALSSPDPIAVAGGALYALAHAGTKSALFLMAGVILNHYGSVDEIDLHGRGRHAVLAPCLMLLAGLSLAGLPPLGPGLGKAVAEHALGGLWPGLFVLTSALTGAAVLRATLRIYFGFGPRPENTPLGPETTGQEEAETDTLLQRVPLSMLVPIMVLLGAGLAVGVVPGLPAAVARAAVTFLDAPAYVSAALGTAPAPTVGTAAVFDVGWTAEGALLDLLAVVIACGIAVLAVQHPRLPASLARPPRWIVGPLTGLRGLHSGHLGDYAAWLVVGVAVLGAGTTLSLLLGGAP
jgi:multicomponent Na+:H+ antiporter subunit D